MLQCFNPLKQSTFVVVSDSSYLSAQSSVDTYF